MRLIRLLLAAKTAIFRTVPLMRDTRVPLALKLVAVAIGVLVISPIDIFSDIPVLGALDDAALLALLSMWFVSQAGKHVEPVAVRPSRARVLACEPIR
ncbi:MAG: DUF1232 domain-containing protein [Candidatus Cybelea sp.]